MLGTMLLGCLLLFCAGLRVRAEEKEQVGTVTVAVERLTIGEGYLVDPCLVPLYKNDNAAKVFDRVITEAGYGYEYSGSLTNKFYLSTIKKADNGKYSLPLCIYNWGFYSEDEDYPEPPADVPSGGEENEMAPDLSEFSFTNTSGWMYSVNGTFPGVGMSDKTLKDGDVMRVCFTIYGLGMDLGTGMEFAGEDVKPLPVPDRDELTKRLALMAFYKDVCKEAGVWNAYTSAYNLAKDYDSTKNQLKKALESLPSKDKILEYAKASEEKQEDKEEDATEKKDDTTEKKEETEKIEILDLSVDSVLKNVKAYILSNDKNPDFTSIWNVIGLTRSGMELSSDYINTFYKNTLSYAKDLNWVLTKNKYTEYSKLILAMTAIGKDASNIDGHNLLADLSDFSKVKMQGVNGPIWALIALKCHPSYKIPENPSAKEQTTEEGLISYILNNQKEDGGWTLAGSSSDSDMTGMALQALASYYGKRDDVTTAVDKALSWLSKTQLASGGYGTSGNETSESVAQIIVALSGLGIDGAKDDRFVKGGNWPMTGLFQYYHSDGGFMHVKAGAATGGGAAGGVVDGMATEQGLYATVAYQRLLAGKTFLYDMSDVTLTAGESAEKVPSGKSDQKDTKKSSEKTDKTTKTTKSTKTTKTTKTRVQTKQASGKTVKMPSGTTVKTAGNISTGTSNDTGTGESTEEGTTGWSFETTDYVPDDVGTETDLVKEEDAPKGAAQTSWMDKTLTVNIPLGGFFYMVVGALILIVIEAIWILIRKKKPVRK